MSTLDDDDDGVDAAAASRPEVDGRDLLARILFCMIAKTSGSAMSE